MAEDSSAASSRRTGYWVLFASISAASMAFVASTSLNVALPAIQVELGARGADLIWIPNSYVMVQASLIVVTGSMGDHFGRNRVCLWGILLFALASIFCGFSTTTNTIIAGRVAQGVGSSMIVPNSLAIASSYFSKRGQGLAIGVWSGFTVLASGIAPFMAGVVTDFGMWRLVFFFHIPLGLMAAFAIMRYVPESFDRSVPKRMSFSGALLVVLGLGGLAFGFIESSTFGFDSPLILSSIIIGILALARFLYDERRAKHAILPLWLFRSRTFSAANFITLIFHGVVQPVTVYLPLNLIQVQGYSATATGLATVPLILISTIVSAAVGPVLDRWGPRLPLVCGLSISALGFVVFSNVGVTAGASEYFSSFFPPIFLFGIGWGLVFAPLTMAAMAAAPANNAGIASGVNNTVVRTGQVLVIGILGGLAITWFGENLTKDPYILSLPAEAQSHLAADAGDLAETSIPDSLSEAEQSQVRAVIGKSFANMYSALMSIAAVFCLLGALVALVGIDDRELKQKRRQAVEDDGELGAAAV